MPVYEYRCESCGSIFDARRSVTDRDGAVTCPEGHTESTRLIPLVAAARGSSPSMGLPPIPRGGGGCGPHCACAN